MKSLFTNKLIILQAFLILTVPVRVFGQARGDSASLTKNERSKYSTEGERLIHEDWPNLGHYKLANKKLADTVNKGNRVVFIGNSITERWLLIHPSFFKLHPNYINRGISGQTTPQILLRFRQDVINLQPRIVLVLAGANDIAGNTGVATLDEIFGNLQSMYELAKINSISVIILSVLPVYDYPWKPGMHPAAKIIALNVKLKEYAKQHHIPYMDLHSLMADERNGLPADLSADGVHPNQKGYLMMEGKVQAVIDKVTFGY